SYVSDNESNRFKQLDYDDIQLVLECDKITDTLSVPFRIRDSYCVTESDLELELAALEMNKEITAPLSILTHQTDI
ncbi:unnamed protein product, partial [Didymodactylos carnosus]